LNVDDTQGALDLFIQNQSPSPTQRKRTRATSLSSPSGRLLQELLTIAMDYEEEL